VIQLYRLFELVQERPSSDRLIKAVSKEKSLNSKWLTKLRGEYGDKI
jgi:hypothetical protein